MPTEPHLFHAYTEEILAFEWKDTPARDAVPKECPETELAEHAERLVRLLEKSRKDRLVLLGIGSGRLLSLLREQLPAATRLTVCESNPARARAVREAFPELRGTPDGSLQWLVDTSPWALVYLLAQDNALPDQAMIQLNPELAAKEKSDYQSLQRTLTLARPHAAINGTPFGHFAVQAPSLSVGCVLHPDEPDLDNFFAQFPDWVEELIVLWDAEELPPREISAACPVHQFARPLNNDFAAQRNHMLEQCSAEWVLYLDGDERLSDDHWTLMPGLFPVRGVQAYFFPRLTFLPDEDHCRVGYGLWPDLQLRLFRNHADLRFEQPVHERLTGVSGRTGLILDAPILHYAHTRKRPEALAQKLQKFDKASGGSLHHRLSPEYPHLPLRRFLRANPLCNELRLLLLPQAPVR